MKQRKAILSTVHPTHSRCQNSTQYSLGILSLDLLLTMNLGWAITETLSQTPAQALHEAKFQDSWDGLFKHMPVGFSSCCQVSQSVRQKEEVAFSLLDHIAFSIHLLLLSDINYGMRKPKPEKLSLLSKLQFRCR